MRLSHENGRLQRVIPNVLLVERSETNFQANLRTMQQDDQRRLFKIDEFVELLVNVVLVFTQVDQRRCRLCSNNLFYLFNVRLDLNALVDEIDRIERLVVLLRLVQIELWLIQSQHNPQLFPFVVHIDEQVIAEQSVVIRLFGLIVVEVDQTVYIIVVINAIGQIVYVTVLERIV